jgi:tetratricopeptide (TPR) repeat protein
MKIIHKASIFLSGLMLISLNACTESDKKQTKPSKEELKARIIQMEDSLKGLQSTIQDIKQIPNLTHFELINRLLDYYHAYPEDIYSAECLDKVHMKYSGMNIHHRAVEYADTLLEKYPKYVNRALVLESQGSAYDVFIQPRDTSKIRKYYSMLLNENPKMDKGKRAGIKDRLLHLELTFDQFIETKMKSIPLP